MSIWNFGTWAGRGSPPAMPIPGAAAWYDASDDGSFTFSSGNVVSQWNDLSGNGRHLIQPTVNKQPSRNVWINGLPAVSGNKGYQHYMYSSSAFTAISQPQTIWLVAKWQTLDSTTQNLVGHLRATMRVTTSNRYAIDANGTLSPSGAADTNLHCFWGIFNGTSSSMRWDGTGSTVGSTGSAQTVTRTALFGNSWTGSFSTTGTEFATGVICETAIWGSALSSEDYVTLRNYSQMKWGTP